MSEKYVKIQNQDARSGAPLSPMVAEGQEKILPRASELTYFYDSISVFDLLSIIPVMLFTAKPDGTWNYINPSLSSFFGLSSDMQKKLNWIKLVHPEDQMDSLINWKTSINSGAPFYIECRFITKNNVYKYLYIHMIPHRNRDGVCLRWIGTATPLIKEYDLISNVDPQRTTEHIRDAVEEIISITAHELSTPLTILLGQAKILQQRMEAAQAQPQNQHTIDIIVEQSQRLSRLLHMLMDVTRIDRGQLYMNMIVLDIGTFVWHIVDMLQSVFAHHILRVNVTNEPLWVRGDEVGLEQVLHNIIQNAVKYSPIGSEVVINVTSDDEYAHIIVRDQGMGIPRNVQPYLFERFFRAHEHNKYAQPGLGLGLYISKSIVELHQGRIELASAVGEGTMVTVSLPRYVE